MEEVSIPFIAGQWSLQGGDCHGSNRQGVCFNPLHCGAVVSSLKAPRRMAEGQGVSIPFIAGQWSLQMDDDMEEKIREEKFQSPSLRGSGLFAVREARRRDR